MYLHIKQFHLENGHSKQVVPYDARGVYCYMGAGRIYSIVVRLVGSIRRALQWGKDCSIGKFQLYLLHMLAIVLNQMQVFNHV